MLFMHTKENVLSRKEQGMGLGNVNFRVLVQEHPDHRYQRSYDGRFMMVSSGLRGFVLLPVETVLINRAPVLNCCS